MAFRSVGEALQSAVAAFREAGIDTPALDARILMAEARATTQERVLMYPEQVMTEAEQIAFQTLVEARVTRVPVAYLTGNKEFFGRTFRCGPATLVPRPDTETLIEAVIRRFPDRSQALSVLDIGTGTGILGISLLKEYPGARAVATDISEAALQVAGANALDHEVAHRFRSVCTEWAKNVEGTFDVVISNPPYIPEGEIDGLMPEVCHEPRSALAGGVDGLVAYRAILEACPSLLTPQGWLVLEVGFGQDTPVMALAQEAGAKEVCRESDLAGVARCVCARW